MSRLSNVSNPLKTFIRWASARLVVNPSRVHLERLNRGYAESLPETALVLDAGAGFCPYKHLFDHANYESADFEKVDKKYGEITYVCDLESIPVADERFDFVLFNQTMEHVPHPNLVLRELARVLRSGGTLLYTGPFFYEEHEQPYDFFRYTRFGLRRLFEEAGLTVAQLGWLEGYLGTVSYQLRTMSERLPMRSADYGGGFAGSLALPLAFLARAFAFALAGVFAQLDIRHKFTGAGYPKNYFVEARKP